MGRRAPEITGWTAVWNDSTAAESGRLTPVGGRAFFPIASMRRDRLRARGRRPDPHALGPETTFGVVVDGHVAPGGVRGYRDPTPDLLNVKNLVAFDPDVVVAPVSRPEPVRTARPVRAALSKVIPDRHAASVGGSP